MQRIWRGAWSDVRYAARQWRRAPGVLVIGLVVLAIGTGATLALFGVLDAIALRPVPVPAPDRLVAFAPVDPSHPNEWNMWQLPAFDAIAARQRVFQTTAAYIPSGVTVEADGTFSQVGAAFVTETYFDVLRMHPALGRFITAQEVKTAARVAVISDGFWRRHYAKSAAVIGTTVRLDGLPFTIVGIAPSGFSGLEMGLPTAFALPLTTVRVFEENDGLIVDPHEQPFVTRGIGRLRNGLNISGARRELQSLWPSVRAGTVPPPSFGVPRERYLNLTMDVFSASRGFSWNRDWYTRPLIFLVASTAGLLLIACVNLASLTLARTLLRLHELTLRSALGAPRWRLLRQGLTEGVLLSGAGTLLGLPLAALGGPWLLALMRLYPDDLSVSLAPDWRVLLLAAGSAIFTGVVVGVVPAWHASRSNGGLALHSRTLRTGRSRWTDTLLIVQVALGLALFVSAGLFSRSLAELRNTNLGFNPDVGLIVSLSHQPDRDRNLDVGAYTRRLLDRLAQIPGVRGAAASALEPVIGIRATEEKRPVATADAEAAAPAVEATLIGVSPAFLETMGVPLVSGRDFNWKDDTDHQQVAIVSARLAARLCPRTDPLGHFIAVADSSNPRARRIQIVGVAADARLADLHTSEPVFMYWPQLQAKDPGGRAPFAVELRLSGPPAALQTPVRRAIESLGQDYVDRQTTFSEQIDRSLLRERLLAIGGNMFGGLAAVIVAIGLCGVMAANVAGRTREIGVRAALGASGRALQWMVMRNALWIGGVGIAIGLPCAWIAGAAVRSVLTGVSPHDLASMSLGVGLTIGMCAAGAWLPARRAASIHPMEALRSE
jgi:predicted permease